TFGALQTAVISGPMRTVPDGANMVFGSAAGTFPNQTYNSSSYLIDLQTVVEGNPAPPTVTSTLPANNATLASTTAPVRATFSRPVDPRRIDALAYTLTRDDAVNVTGPLTYHDATHTTTYTP